MADQEFTAPVAAKKTEKVAESVTATVTEKMKQTTEAATKGLKDFQTEVTGGLKQAAELARGYADVQRTTVETVVKAGQIYAEGLQALATNAVAANRTQFEQTVAHLKALTGVKSVKEAVSLQTQFARDTAARALTESSNFAETYLKIAGQALAPVTARAREAAEKVKAAA
ncbi:MAG TPA: phasin family protein [Acetobacteraceae bacterium]|nr:phasin family protein [Acetobacteraceae bacterium]